MSPEAMITLTAGVMKQYGLTDWGIVRIKLTDVLVQVRPGRKVVALNEEFLATGNSELLVVRLSHLLSAIPESDGREWVAECPSCYRLFFRREEPEVLHTCAECRQPLEFR